MGTVNVCVKRSYITAASLIAILSGLLLAMTLFSHGYYHEDEEIEKVLPGLQFMYGTSVITILLVTAGLYGVCKRKKWMLICYIVGMILCSMLLGVLDIQGAAMRPTLQCCGMSEGYREWGYNIPESCLCAEDAVHPCVAAPRNSSLFENIKTNDPIMIYKEPCLTYLIAHALFAIDVLLGVILGIILLWVLSVGLCVVILCQMNRKEDVPAVVYSPEAKAGNYSVLSDDAELT